MREYPTLMWRRLPGRLDVNQTAEILGFQPHDIPILARVKLLKPLGSPAPNAQKYFSAAEIESLSRDVSWTDKATRAIEKHWKEKNRSKKTITPQFQEMQNIDFH